MRRQLRGIDEDERAAVVRQPGDVRDRRHLTRDVRGTGDRDERERVAGAVGRLERMDHRLEEVGGGWRERQVGDTVLGARGAGSRGARTASTAPGADGKGDRQEIRRLGRVAHEDHVVGVGTADEAGYG